MDKARGPLVKLLGQERSDEIMEQVVETAKIMLTPLDLDALLANGILEKEGESYRILKPEELPEHAKKKISVTSTKRMPNGEMGEALVKFRKPLTEKERKEWEKIIKRAEG